MITYCLICETFIRYGFINLENIIWFILILPFTLALDITKDIIIFTTLLNIVRFTIQFI